MPILRANYSNLDHEEMASNIGLNVKHMPILIDSFISESNGAITMLQDAIQAKDYNAIHKQAHFIKGSAGNLKFNEIYEMCKEMEKEATSENADFDYDGYFKAVQEAVATIK